MKIQHFIISILLVCMILLGCITYITNLSTNYGETADLSGFNNTQYYLNKTQQTTSNLNSILSDFKLDSKIELLMIPYKFFQVGWNLGKIVLDSWGTLFAMLSDAINIINTSIGGAIGIPAYILSGIEAILIIIIVMIALYAFFKWKFED